jgi:hypothetical protein
LIRRLKKKCSDLKINTLYGYGYRLVWNSINQLNQPLLLSFSSY